MAWRGNNSLMGGADMNNIEKVNTMIQVFSKQIKESFGDKLSEIILFGSYARGDYDGESDVDIMILMNISRNEERLYFDELVKMTEKVYDSFGYSIVFSPIVTRNEFFHEWKDALPFYRNVFSEGVRIGA